MSGRNYRRGRYQHFKLDAFTVQFVLGRANARPVSGAGAAASGWGNSSDSFNPMERSSSAFPTLTESMNRLAIGTTPASARERRTQSVREPTRRRGLYSAVPDTAVLSPVDRPDNGGTKGQEITVYTNHFRVEIDDATVYQYDIDICMIDRNHRTRFANKDDRWEALQTFVKERKGFPAVW